MELTSKQRSNLKSIAQAEAPVTQIGKNGITPTLIEAVDKALSARELVKITVLENSGAAADSYAPDLAAATDSTVVVVIGRKIVLYRKSTKPGVEHIVF